MPPAKAPEPTPAPVPQPPVQAAPSVREQVIGQVKTIAAEFDKLLKLLAEE
jgi:hypothetical protein